MKTNLNNKLLFSIKIIGIIFGIVLIGYIIYLEITDTPAVVSDLSIGWSQSKQQIEDIVVPTGMPNLRVCGFLESDRQKFLYVNVFNIDGNSFYGGSAGEFINPGNFCVNVKIHSALFSGEYVAKVYYQRQEITQINFEVK